MLKEFPQKLVAKERLSPEERADLSIFVALGGFRTPGVIESIKVSNSEFITKIAKELFANVDVVKEKLRDKPHAPESEEELEQQGRQMIDFAKGENYKVETSHR